jgi:hypothetical protein
MPSTKKPSAPLGNGRLPDEGSSWLAPIHPEAFEAAADVDEGGFADAVRQEPPERKSPEARGPELNTRSLKGEFTDKTLPGAPRLQFDSLSS